MSRVENNIPRPSCNLVASMGACKITPKEEYVNNNTAASAYKATKSTVMSSHCVHTMGSGESSTVAWTVFVSHPCDCNVIRARPPP